MAPLLLMVFHLILILLMMYISLLVSLDIQSSTTKGRQYPTSRYRYPTDNQTQSQFQISSMVKFNEALTNTHNMNKSSKLSHHTHYHINHLFKIILVT
eukprot:1014549_1